MRICVLSRSASVVVAVLAAILVALIAIYLWRFNPLAIGLPRDADLVSFFRSNRSTFEKLRVMATEDRRSIAEISEDTLAESSLSQERRAEYIRLLSIRPKMSIEIGPHEVTFAFAAGGLGLAVGREWMKGITYLPDGYEKGGLIVRRLDGFGLFAKRGLFLVPIERNWYVMFSQFD